MITLKPTYTPRAIFSLLLSVFFLTNSQAQYPTFHWAKSFEKITTYANSNNARTIGVDAAGNVYSAGQFEFSIDLDPGPGVYAITATGQFNKGFYISKLDANGNFVWGKQISAVLSFSQLELKVDAAGNIYIVTDTSEPCDLDPGPGDQTITLNGSRNVIIVKLNMW